MSTILIVEDSPTQAQRFALMLEEAGFEVERAERLADGLQRIRRGGIDLLLLDLTLPDSEGLPTFVTARSKAPDTPIVVLTNLDDESLAAATLQRGAHDYLIKGEVNQSWLVRSIQHAIVRRTPQDAEAPAQKQPDLKPKQILDVKPIGAVSVVRFQEKRLLDANEIAVIGEKLIKLVDSGCQKMLISFANVDYVSNGALSVLLAIRRKMLMAGGKLCLCDLSENVFEHLSVRQFHKLFDIRDDVESAIEGFETGEQDP